MMSIGDRLKRSDVKRPHDNPIILTSSTELSAHDLRQLSRHSGKYSASLRVTRAPNFAASTPGRAVPAPNCND